MGIEGAYLSIVKAMCDKPTANILSGEKLNIPPKIRNKTSGLEVLATAIRKKENKGNPDWKRRSKPLTVCR